MAGLLRAAPRKMRRSAGRSNLGSPRASPPSNQRNNSLGRGGWRSDKDRFRQPVGLKRKARASSSQALPKSSGKAHTFEADRPGGAALQETPEETTMTQPGAEQGREQAAGKTAIRPFHVNVPEADLLDLRRRIE